MRRIELKKPDGRPVYIDSSYIASVEDTGDSYRFGYSALVIMKNGSEFKVMETGAHIMALIDAKKEGDLP